LQSWPLSANVSYLKVRATGDNAMDVGLAWFMASTAILAALLFFPVSKLVWVLSVRRFENKLARSTTEEERQGQLQRARFIGLIVSLVFAALFNYNVFGIPGHS
jgi:membrane protein implicated in regulation of membrane protease activity